MGSGDLPVGCKERIMTAQPAPGGAPLSIDALVEKIDGGWTPEF
jgi:hypothetical protein